MIRFEDLPFNPKKLVKRLCQCINGKFLEEMRVLTTVSKNHGHGSNNRSSALKQYGDKNYRYSYNKFDLEFAKNNLNEKLISYFGYDIVT